ncbi:MAG: hypothetical protein NC293_08605 [Roseburia sp.]|nr:hypothetical protein [Roseburia sp.]
MPISAIDFSTVAPRSSEASTIAGKEQNQLQHMEVNGQVNFQRSVEQQNQRTVETKESETEEYSFDDSGKNGYGGDGGRKRKKKSEDAPMAPRSDSSFDIMI